MEYHDDETLNKVRAALRRSIMGLTDKSAEGIINEMQNEGILFRERADGEAVMSGLEKWTKEHRDEFPPASPEWWILDRLLDDVRDGNATGTFPWDRTDD